MKVVIAGSRHGRPNRELTEAIAQAGFEITEVVHGGAAGVDTQADQLGRALAVPVTVFRADWQRLGKSAGPLRNRTMARYADALIALDGGDGTRDMIRAAKRAHIPVYVHPPSQD
jgi:predicted Rossmann-fold nucleotide-binding protein